MLFFKPRRAVSQSAIGDVRQLYLATTQARTQDDVSADLLERLRTSEAPLARHQATWELARRALEASRGKSGLAAASDVEKCLGLLEESGKSGGTDPFKKLEALAELFSRRSADLPFDEWKKQGTPVVGSLDTRLLNCVISAHIKELHGSQSNKRDQLYFWLQFEQSYHNGVLRISPPTQKYDNMRLHRPLSSPS